jgi:hypothetical protein
VKNIKRYLKDLARDPPSLTSLINADFVPVTYLLPAGTNPLYATIYATTCINLHLSLYCYLCYYMC